MMRGHWEAGDPMALAPNEQQQQTNAEEQEHPLHSTTTPAWGIADRIVKEEPPEDKNNDSGVSPGHYTSNSDSPASGRSSSTANCSLSPGSTTSQDSNNMQCSSFDYSPQEVFKGCNSPSEFAQRDQQPDQAMEVASNSPKPAVEEAEYGQDTLQCPICAFTTTDKMKFTEHVSTHCSTKCDNPDFMKAVLGQLAAPGTLQEENDRSSPGQGDRSEHESEEAEEPGLRVPRINSQGKVKTFRCKQCNFSAITKLEFWEHSRGHIKAEKLLTCPKCPFVTEYKHHLEYHLRNHIGSKPFKCDKCSYSCVNKSMLNSHLKSHSNVYQYRCANCSYATKYCHSLKLHLRKYSHQPAMVLNADGSPNPLPIIDVYGTRRGPKQKPMKNQDDNSQGSTALNNNNVQPSLVPNQMALPAQMSPVGHHLDLSSGNTGNGMSDMNGLCGISGMNNISDINGLGGINGISGINGINGIGGINGLSSVNGMRNMNGMNGINGLPGMAGMNTVNGIATVSGMSPNQATMVPFAYNPIFSGFQLANSFATSDESADKKLERIKSNMIMEYVKAVGAQRLPEDFPQDLALSCLGMNGNKLSDGFPSATGTAQATMESAETSNTASSPVPFDRPAESPEPKATPLDLSKPELTSNSQADQQKPAANSPRATGTSRRKGRAFKLERRVQEDESEEENNVRETPEVPVEQPSTSTSPSCSSPESKDEEDKRSFGGVGMSNEFSCQYCEIAFGNVVMYTVHMGYHGYKDPYTCNMCGHQCTDKVSFFLHIARSKHS